MRAVVFYPHAVRGVRSTAASFSHLTFSKRHAHSSYPSAPCTSSGASQQDPPKGPSASLQLDDTEEWIGAHVRRSVECGRQTKEAADYFAGIVQGQPDLRGCLVEARRLMGGQSSDQLTNYQQGQFADRLCHYMSGMASDKLRRAHAEEQSTRRYTQDGTPTGENYWFEAGSTLSSPGVPGFVKDEILQDMQQDRARKSPAYERPREETQMAQEDDGYAEHLRRQRSRLLDNVDFK